LFVEHGEDQEVVIEAGENLPPDIIVKVIDNTLIIRDTNTCNFVRDYGSTTARITIPYLKLIRTASSYDIRSAGILELDTLTLTSNATGGFAVPRKRGDFYLNINSTNLRVDANVQSVFHLCGNVENGSVAFTDENP
jgi:hypothetical protein